MVMPPIFHTTLSFMTPHPDETTTNIINKAVLGGTASFGATVVSGLSELELWLRLLSLCVGITVGIASLISIIRNSRK